MIRRASRAVGVCLVAGTLLLSGCSLFSECRTADSSPCTRRCYELDHLGCTRCDWQDLVLQIGDTIVP